MTWVETIPVIFIEFFNDSSCFSSFDCVVSSRTEFVGSETSSPLVLQEFEVLLMLRETVYFLFP